MRTAAGVAVRMTDLFGVGGQELLRRVELAPAMRAKVNSCLRLIDELNFEVQEDKADAAAKQIRATMESVVKLDVPLVVDVGYGVNWAAAHQ